jgi:hypothetical protein
MHNESKTLDELEWQGVRANAYKEDCLFEHNEHEECIQTTINLWVVHEANVY